MTKVVRRCRENGETIIAFSTDVLRLRREKLVLQQVRIHSPRGLLEKRL
jgi:hypothetical protein